MAPAKVNPGPKASEIMYGLSRVGKELKRIFCQMCGKVAEDIFPYS
jgi:hypothetical protein